MISPPHMKELIVKPTLKFIGLYSASAEALVLGTFAQESGMGQWLKQLGAGPAIGPGQMEPDTHNDIWENFLEYRYDLAERIRQLDGSSMYPSHSAQRMAGNLYYATAMTRLQYYRQPEALPPADDIEALASYWKRYYNTHKGAGTTTDFIRNFKRFKL